MLNFKVDFRKADKDEWQPCQDKNGNSYAVFPLNFANLLDERLDEVYLTLIKTPWEIFTPTTEFKIDFYENNIYTKSMFYIVANDNVEEKPNGSKKYNHELYLIERTKLLEGYICDSITFTNPLQMPDTNAIGNFTRTYTSSAAGMGSSTSTVNDKVVSTELRSKYKTNNETTLPNATELVKGDLATYNNLWSAGIQSAYYQSLKSVDGSMNIPISDTQTVTVVNAGTYELKVIFGGSANSQGAGGYSLSGTIIYTLTFVDGFKLKKWNISDCIKRILDLAESLQFGEDPKFSLDPEQQEKFNNILAPEFTMTQCTLREQLKIIGGYIHAEPRLDENNIIHFDEYGGTEIADISSKPYLAYAVSQSINEYCTEVDTSPKNIVNALNYAQGVIIEPDLNNFKTVRTESVNTRIESGNAIASTSFPIYRIVKVMCGIVKKDNSGWQTEPVDITKYVFEKTQYDANMSSYSGQYPFSKAYSIYYTQGSENIGGMFFKEENAFHPSFSKYAIYNILTQARATNVPSTITEQNVAFQISYIPIYNSRFTHGKPYVITAESGNKRTVIYNQGDNLIETQYYGENVKGAAARLGNVEKTITYMLSSLSQIPKAGMLFDKDYYISAVSVSVMPMYIKCTLAISKDFNRISEYIGISSNKRLYEVSERQAYDRNVLYKDYIIVGDYETTQPDDNPLLAENGLYGGVLDSLVAYDKIHTSQDYQMQHPITYVKAWGGTYNTPTETQNTINATDKFEYVSQDSVRGKTVVTFKFKDRNGGTVNGEVKYAYYTSSGIMHTDTMKITEVTTDEYEYTFDGTSSKVTIIPLYIEYYYGTVAPLPIVELPVISSSFGNVMTFSWTYKDNYSAGVQSIYQTNGKVSGYFAQDYAYCDYYGRMYYYNFALAEVNTPIDAPEDEEFKNAYLLPKSNLPYYYLISTYSNTKNYPFLIRKDSREILRLNYQVEFKSNRQNLIIGSGLASISHLVSEPNYNNMPTVVLLKKHINKLTKNLQAVYTADEITALKTLSTKLEQETVEGKTRWYITSTKLSLLSQEEYISWAIVTEPVIITEYVETERGEVEEQTTISGGDIILACNLSAEASLKKGDTIGKIYFTRKHKI